MSLPTEDKKWTLGAALKLLKTGPAGTFLIGIHSGFQTTRTSFLLPSHFEWRSANMASTSQRSQPDAMDDGDDEMDGFVNMLEAAAMNELQKIQ